MDRMKMWLADQDVKWFGFVNQRLHCQLLDILLPRITHLGGATATLTGLGLTMILCSDPIRLWAVQALIALIISHVAVQVIKKIVPRQRPYLILPGTRLCPHPLKDYSFPSGHFTASFSIASVFALHSIVLAFLVVPLAVAIAFSRMYLGLHYPTDCLAGAVLGTVTACCVVWISGF
ncbi:undecaprenyl-diphosphatase [Caldalkalibacillus uzonensis]|uniref:Undecaprenyl-diphosphatase n=1 Tax=Caldalkalibacillus uzonensis TaxID=353224 RepID=A0ABU0CV45_9BACI|nr:phosphatase PAP2 family protein [Caldalkalibacillus uzonensis]MDQ0340300.1 undecaprenyl-diphosphatase [Caldalkalibacillus uzonensis]